MGRNRSYTRHQRKRAIKRKLSILKNVKGHDLMEFKNGVISPIKKGRYAKGKVHCSCRMCNYEKFHHIEKNKVKAKTKAMKDEIEHYKSDWHD